MHLHDCAIIDQLMLPVIVGSYAFLAAADQAKKGEMIKGFLKHEGWYTKLLQLCYLLDHQLI